MTSPWTPPLAITAGIDEIIETLFIALALVILVVFIFIQDWRATLIPTIAIPVSLLATFMAFPMIGFTINVLSLLGLVLAIGIVVDDAIVVVEAVQVKIEEGMTPKEATKAAMKEVTAPVIATTLVMVAIFIPVAVMGGITGRLYQQFAITVAVSVVFSSINALTLSPALCGLLLRKQQPMRGPLGAFFRLFNSVRQDHLSLHRLYPHRHPQNRHRPRLYDYPDRRTGLPGQTRARRLHAQRGHGLPDGQHPAARRGLDAAHRRGDRKG
jgi:multidrug efflux pump subunit AcrB